MVDHLKAHFKIRDYECQEENCSMSFSSHQALFMHKNIYHRHKYARSCQLCKKNFHTKSYYDTHMRAKHGGKRRLCFNAKFGLINSIFPTIGERTYFCDFPDCTKAFFSSSELNLHRKRVHSEPVSCPVCQKSFACEYAVKKHMKYHQEKKFVCSEINHEGKICGKKFVENHFLNSHIKVAHRNIREFVCKECGICYASSTDLRSHMKNIHEKMRIKCEFCGSLMGSKSYYRKHILLHHKNLDDEALEEILEKIKRTKFEDLFTHAVDQSKMYHVDASDQ